jgi:hypothetical protein
MSNFPTSFRFENQELQGDLCARVKALAIKANEQPDGTLTFAQAQWGNVNREAHKIRDQLFGRWSFLNFAPEEYLRKQIDLIRAHKVPHELEYHGARLVLLLPRNLSDEHKKLLMIPDIPE